ncbi:hypothetical protein OSTOST_22486, partial [Ostertagia ostertagi]
MQAKLEGGVQDTNGTNERRHIVEAMRAFEEWENCGVLQQSDRNRVVIELRGDDSIMIFESAVLSALYFTSFCASGRPMEGVKQEIWSNQCEYLRNKQHEISAPLPGYPHLSSNTSKHDVVGRLHALNQQFATLVRRGALLHNTYRLFHVAMEYWSRYKYRRDVGEVAPRMGSLPPNVLYGDQRDGGFGCGLDYRSRQCYGVQQSPPHRFQPKQTRVSEGMKARGASDLAQSMLSGTQGLAAREETLRLLAAEIHHEVSLTAKLPEEIAAAHRQYELEFKEWVDKL